MAPHHKPPTVTYFETATEFWFDMADLWVSTFFYGIYLVLFCICIYILVHRPRSTSNWILLGTAIMLFTLSTIQTVLQLVTGSGAILQISFRVIPYESVFFTMDMLYVANNIIADGLIIYRCWVIWNKNYWITLPGIVGLTALVVITIVNNVGANFDLTLRIFYGLTLATNLLVSCMTAGRIWWIYRTSRPLLSDSSKGSSKHYQSSIAIILESGLIYSLFVAARIAVDDSLANPMVTDMLSQVVGIVPTLIIVRVGLGVSIDAPSSTVKPTVSHPFHIRSGPNLGRTTSLDSEASFAPLSTSASGATYIAADGQRVLAPVRYASAGVNVDVHRTAPTPPGYDLEKGLAPGGDFGERPRTPVPMPPRTLPPLPGQQQR